MDMDLEMQFQIVVCMIFRLLGRILPGLMERAIIVSLKDLINVWLMALGMIYLLFWRNII